MNEAVRNATQPILEIENLSISFFTRRGEIPAVMDFSCSVLPGEAISATEAERLGLVNRVLPVELFLEEAKNSARKIAAKPVLAIKAAKEAVLKAANTPLDEGLDYERKSFYLLFASEDRREGMKAFLEKRKPEFQGK